MRHEIKMVTEGLDLPWVRSWVRLHPAGFSELYPPRRVNNVYFDTPRLASYEENLSGIASRVKLRLRWYGTDLSNVNGIVELKCKQALDGWKVSHKLQTPIDFATQSWSDIVTLLRNELPEHMRLRLNFASQPVLINRYDREYHQSFDGKVRITLDYAQQVFDQWTRQHPNLSVPVPVRDLVIIESKADHQDSERLAETVSRFPLRVSKASKYVSGVESLLGH
jgi:SPX domain protein involved in polyphosphate accumulation